MVSVRGTAGGIVAWLLMALCIGMAAAPIGVVHATFGNGPGLWSTVLLSAAAAAGAMVWLVRQWRRPVMDVVVSDIGLLGDGAAGWCNDIRWDRLQRNPQGAVDVWVALSSRRDEALQWLHFFTAAPAGGAPIERRLRLLVPAALGCLQYANAFALRRALLLQLATRADPPLRFDPMLFVQMGLDPHRWTPMPWPRRVLALLMGVPLAALFGATFRWLDALPSAWWGVGVLVVGMVACAVFAVTAFGVLYPRFRGAPYVFSVAP